VDNQSLVLPHVARPKMDAKLKWIRRYFLMRKKRRLNRKFGICNRFNSECIYSDLQEGRLIKFHNGDESRCCAQCCPSML